MHETLRLYPIVPFNVRLALKDTTLPHGGGLDGMQPVGVLKGTPIGYAPLSMQRRADIYPPVSADFPPPEQFAPQRWEKWTPKPWTYVTFLWNLTFANATQIYSIQRRSKNLHWSTVCPY
jgi:cytochrome P450